MSIINAYYAQMLDNLSKAPLPNFEDTVLVLLELSEVMAGTDGEQYAQLLRQIFSGSDEQLVMEQPINRVLGRLRNGTLPSS